MKLLPHYFKWIGISLFFLGFVLAIDDFRLGCMEGYTRTTIENFNRILPEVFSFWGDIVSLTGLLIYILSKNKTDDEFAQKLRYETAFLVMVLTILVILVIHIINQDFSIKPSIFIFLQMIAYLVIRSIKKSIILAE